MKRDNNKKKKDKKKKGEEEEEDEEAKKKRKEEEDLIFGWEKVPLSMHQLKYAALDARLGILFSSWREIGECRAAALEPSLRQATWRR
jgi:hypothetical protein